MTVATDYNWTLPSTEQLEQFSGQDIAALYQDQSFVGVAIQLAADRLFLCTGLAGWPTSGFEQRLLTNGILEMAQHLYLAQPFKNVLASPFSSEKIGNYSYTKISQALAKGEATGLDWFDQAVQYFQDVAGSSATRGMEEDSIWVTVGDAETELMSRQLLGPSDLQPSPFGGEPSPKGYGEGFRGNGNGAWPQP